MATVHITQRLRVPTGTLVLGLIVAVASWLAEPLLPPPAMTPDTAQTVNFMVIGAFESLALGLAVTFALFAFPLFRRANSGLLWATYVSLIWLLGSWWPHDKLHARIGMHNMWALIGVEWGFHVTLIIATLVVGTAVLWLVRDKVYAQ